MIPDDPGKDPAVPALTPVGFAQWTTIRILSYPDEEARRLEKVVQALPIDADGSIVDGKPERLPKQISRCLFPPSEDGRYRSWIRGAISDLKDPQRSRKCKS